MIQVKNHINIAFNLQQLAFTKHFVVAFKLQLPNLNLKRTLNSDPAIAALVATYGADDIAWSNCGLEWKKLSKLFVDTMISNASLDASYGQRKQENLRAVVWRWHACINEGTSLGAELTFKLAELMVLMGTPNIFLTYFGAFMV
ncbi:hypothetical protein WN944_009341 [Citrus x changshan-huyou]|uniref:Uncharacterized protein n=1 Tax=Citrus x changshan-huyou TaxID=2935761 RepID=A0AAP0QW50_9ROSI